MSEFDFDPNDIAQTILQSHYKVAEANNWAEARVAIANNRANTYAVVMLLCLFITAAAATGLILSAQQTPPTPILIKEKQPN